MFFVFFCILFFCICIFVFCIFLHICAYIETNSGTVMRWWAHADAKVGATKGITQYRPAGWQWRISSYHIYASCFPATTRGKLREMFAIVTSLS